MIIEKRYRYQPKSAVPAPNGKGLPFSDDIDNSYLGPLGSCPANFSRVDSPDSGNGAPGSAGAPRFSDDIEDSDGGMPDLAPLRARFAPIATRLPAIAVNLPSISSYDALLPVMAATASATTGAAA